MLLLTIFIFSKMQAKHYKNKIIQLVQILQQPGNFMLQTGLS